MTPDLSKIKRRANKLTIIDTEECTIHPGYKDKDGYSQFQFRIMNIKYSIGAHRASYMLYHNRELTINDVIMHTCDTPACINPKHLKLGDHWSNVKDRVLKDRSAKGVNNGNYKHGNSCK